jgi:hypothetical protein
METPTARVLKEGRYRVGASQISPYRYYYAEISPLKGLEIGGRLTEVQGVPALSAAYGNTKDKAIDLKYQFISEGKYWPAVAFGITDPNGTRVYASQYIVMNKQIYPFDFSLGLGNGRFGKKPLPSTGEGWKVEILSDTRGWLSEAQLFGGIQFTPSPKYSFMVEYSPIRFNEQTQDPAQSRYFREPVPSKINFGFRWRPFTWTEVDLSYQRGNQVGVNLSVAFDIGQPLIPLYDHPYKERPQYRSKPLDERIIRGLHSSGFADIGVINNGLELWVEAANIKYYYRTRAIEVAFRVINNLTPDTIQKIHLKLTENGIPDIELSVDREDLKDYFDGRLSEKGFSRLTETKTDVVDRLPVEKKHRRLFEYGLKPAFRTFLNDPSGYFKYRLGAEGWLDFHPWRGSSFVVGIETYPVNTVSSTNAPLSRPVRTDMIPYLQDNVVLGRLLYDQIEKFPQEIYGRIAVGLLEAQYAGLDGEIAKPFFDGQLLLGISGSLLKKREPNILFSLKQNDWMDYYRTAFINVRWNIPKVDISIDLKIGQFLAEDKGTRITVSRSFNGVILSAWYSLTDTSLFTDQFNKGYHEYGIGLTIPLRMFSGGDSRTSYSYAISPWTRDVAQDINHYNNLFDFIGGRIRR